MRNTRGLWVSGGLVQWEVMLAWTNVNIFVSVCTWRNSRCVKLSPLKAAGNVNIGDDACACVFVCVHMCVCGRGVKS